MNQALDLVKPPYPTGEPVFQLGADEGNCQPGVASTFTSSQGTGVNINNNNNDTGFTFNKITYQLLSPDAQFRTVTSNDFKVAISSDSKTATFSDALLPPGSGARINRTISDGSAVNFSVTLDSSTSVPEPTSILATLAAGALVVARKRKKPACHD